MKHLTIICVAITLAGCTVSPVEKPTEPTASATNAGKPAVLSEQERAVIRAMLEHETQGHKESRPLIVLSSLSSAEIVMKGLDEDDASDRIDVSAIRDFRRANKCGFLWPQDMDSRYDIRFLSAEKSTEIWKDQDGWNRFYRMFPKAHGITTISRVGFSKDGQLALVYRGCQSEWLAGGGNIYVLRLERGKWTITHEHVGSHVGIMSFHGKPLGRTMNAVLL